MKKTVNYLFALLFALIMLPATSWAQEEAAADEVKEGWSNGAGLGLDFAQLLQLNPKVGAGQNSIGFGGAVNYFANYKKGRIAWDNALLWQFGVQRLGTGVIAQGASTSKIPFQKQIDELRFDTKYGYRTSETSKFYYTADGTFKSQLTKTYQGDETLPGNYLSDLPSTTLNSKFFAPATILLSAGVDYKHDEHLSVYFSPVAAKWIIVNDDEIAALNVHGNPVGENTFSAFGALAKVAYNNKFLNDKIVYGSTLSLFSNYKLDPQNIDVDWANQIDFNIYKGLSATVLFNVFYDHDVKVQVTDYEEIGGVRLYPEDHPNPALAGTPWLGRRAYITQQFLLSYKTTF